jgi:hypothetical protein
MVTIKFKTFQALKDMAATGFIGGTKFHVLAGNPNFVSKVFIYKNDGVLAKYQAFGPEIPVTDPWIVGNPDDFWSKSFEVDDMAEGGI